MSKPAALLPKLSLEWVKSLRDTEWEAKERSYHDTALEDVNSLVRKYNGLAPYPVRRPYYTRQAEVKRAYQEAGEDIIRGIEETILGQTTFQSEASGSQSSPRTNHDPSSGYTPLRIRDILRNWFAKLIGR